MRCYCCGCFSFRLICRNCVGILSNPTAGIRIIDDDFRIYYFYNYSEIKNLLLSKHKFVGSFIFSTLSKICANSLRSVAPKGLNATIIPIDDRLSPDYSHTAIIAKAMAFGGLRVSYATLHSDAKVSYSGKDYSFRLNNPRNFKILKPVSSPVILIDDIITTGSTIRQAKDTLLKAGVDVLFAMVLADARY